MNLRTRTFLIVGLFVGLCSPALRSIAQPMGSPAPLPSLVADAPTSIHGYFDSSFRDHYLSYRTEKAVNRTPVWWSELDVDLPWYGLYFGSFGSYVVSSTRSQQSANEIDVFVGKRGKVAGVNYDFSLRYFDCNRIEDLNKGDYAAAILLLTDKERPIFANNTLQAALDLEWYASTGDYIGGGPLVQPGVIHKWRHPFGIDFLTIVDKDWFAWDNLAFKKFHDDGLFFRTDLGLQWKLCERLTVTLPGARIIVPLITPSDGRNKADASLWGGFRYAF